MARVKVIFLPLLAGASFRDRLLACLGALIGVGLVGLTCAAVFPASMPWIVAPIGASTVLLFAVPASPLAQPWSIVGGNSLSALVGVCVVLSIADPVVAAAVAVSAAILLMSLLRCLHPPGGAAALSAVLAAPLVMSDGGARFLLLVAVNSILLTAAGWIFHRYSGHSYPHRPEPVEGRALPPAPATGLLMEDIDAALGDLGETFDIGREDLALLLGRAELHAERRRDPGRDPGFELDARAKA
ncbi:MAG: HPP family protein [Sphingopyxis sp.]|uniref:HPP family protein n=1 Tax=Sphingopyxis sp. TaxID=1908224 RepID=UPI002ABC512D|nr:HPP family protein [Sphingopyxis sp.]MDZ3832238.1 HPP family protein [Sphingopyxis sp.]